MQLSLVIAAEASDNHVEQLVDVVYELLVKLGTDARYGLFQDPQAHTDGSSPAICQLYKQPIRLDRVWEGFYNASPNEKPNPEQDQALMVVS